MDTNDLSIAAIQGCVWINDRTIELNTVDSKNTPIINPEFWFDLLSKSTNMSEQKRQIKALHD